MISNFLLSGKARQAHTGEAGLSQMWEIVATTALMLVTLSACTWFAVRLYRLGALMYGQKSA